jgi:hypothetical protein
LRGDLTPRGVVGRREPRGALRLVQRSELARSRPGCCRAFP